MTSARPAAACQNPGSGLPPLTHDDGRIEGGAQPKSSLVVIFFRAHSLLHITSHLKMIPASLLFLVLTFISRAAYVAADEMAIACASSPNHCF